MVYRFVFFFIKYFDVEYIIKKGDYRNRYKNVNNNYEFMVVYLVDRDKIRRKCQFINFLKLLDYIMNEVCGLVFQREVFTDFYCRS